MSLIEKTIKLNLHPIWKRRVCLWNSEFVAPSLDRLTALHLHRFRLMGRLEKQFFETHLKAGMTVVDIGANQGLYTMLFSALVGSQGKVMSFEPEPDMYQALVDNVMRNRALNVECHNIALGSRPGTAMLSRSLLHRGDNRLGQGHNEKTSRKEAVPVNTLDAVVAERPVHFIKIDVQGWEGEVFRGMQKVLENSPDLLIHFEFWPKGLRTAGFEPSELLETLSNQGFKLFEVGSRPLGPVSNFSRLIKRLPGGRFTNLLARR